MVDLEGGQLAPDGAVGQRAQGGRAASAGVRLLCPEPPLGQQLRPAADKLGRVSQKPVMGCYLFFN